MKNKIDYAPYYLEAAKKLKEANDFLKSNKFEEASLCLEGAVVELRMMQIAVKSHVE